MEKLPKEVRDIITVYGGSLLAISTGNEYVKQILLDGLSLPETWMSGNDETIKWLIKYNIRGFSDDTVKKTITKGDLDLVNFFYKDRKENNFVEMDYAAENGRIEILKWFHENRTEGCTTNAMDQAAKEGHFHIVK